MGKRLSATDRRPAGSPPAAKEMSIIIQRDIGISIPPEKLQELIAGRFRALSILAREMHEVEEQRLLALKQAENLRIATLRYEELKAQREVSTKG